jgi:hypothetical protein
LQEGQHTSQERGDVSYKRGNVPYKRGGIPCKRGNVPYKRGGILYKRGDAPYKRGNAPYKRGNIPYKEGDDFHKRGKRIMRVKTAMYDCSRHLKCLEISMNCIAKKNSGTYVISMDVVQASLYSEYKPACTASTKCERQFVLTLRNNEPKRYWFLIPNSGLKITKILR